MRLGNFQSVPFSAVYVQRVPVGSNVMATMAASVGAGVVVLLLLFAVCFLYRRKLQQKKQFKHIMLQVGHVQHLLIIMGESNPQTQTRICASLGSRMKFKTLCYPINSKIKVRVWGTFANF